MGKDTVCRLEERKYPAKKPAIEFLNDISNPFERVEKHLTDIERKIDAAAIGINNSSVNNNSNTSPSPLPKPITSNKQWSVGYVVGLQCK